MSTIASCPRCAQHVSIPIDVAPTATVRCPICQVEYRLQEALSKIPPLLILVDAGPQMGSDSGIFGMPGLAEPDHRLPPAESHDDLASAAPPIYTEPTHVEPMHAEDMHAETPPAPPENVADGDIVDFDADEVELDPEAPPTAADGHPDDSGSEELELDLESFEMPAGEMAAGDAAESHTPEGDAAAGDVAEGETAEPDHGLEFGDAAEFGHLTHASGEGPEIPLDDEPSYQEPAYHESADHEAVDGAGDSDEIELADPDTYKFAGVPQAAESPEGLAAKPADARKVPRRNQPKRKPSLLSNIIGFGGSGLFGLGFAYFILIWVQGPAGDKLGIGRKLPGWMVPSAFNEPKTDNKQVADLPFYDTSKDKSPVAPGTLPGPEDKKPAAGAQKGPSGAAPKPANESLSTKGELDDPLDELGSPDPLEAPGPDPLGADEKPKEKAKEEDASKADLGFGKAPAAGDELPEETPDETASAEPETASNEKPQEPDEPAAEESTEPEPKENPAPAKTAAAPEKSLPGDNVPPPQKRTMVLRKPVSYGPDQLNQALKDVQQASAALAAAKGASGKELVTLRSRLYVKFCALSQMVTFAEPGVEFQLPGGPDAVAEMVHKFVGDPTQFDAVGRGAAKWLQAKRNSDGVLLPGTVQSSTKNGDLHEMQLALPGDVVVTVVGEFQPPDDGSQVIVLGSIVENPKEKLVDYSGDQPMVVWKGMVFGL